MKWAWVENGIIKDIAHDEPQKIYHPDVAKFYTSKVSDEAENGDKWVDGKLIKKDPFIQPPAPVKKWSLSDVRDNLLLAEKVKWDNDSTPEIITVKTELIVAKEKNATTELLKFLVDSGAISQASMDKVLA